MKKILLLILLFPILLSAQVRLKDKTATTSMAADDRVYLDGLTNGVRAGNPSADYRSIFGGTPSITGQWTFSLIPQLAWTPLSAGASQAAVINTQYYVTAFTSNTSITGYTGTPANGTRVAYLLIGCNGTSTFNFPSAQRSGDPTGTSLSITPTAGTHQIVFVYVNSLWYYSDDNVSNTVATGGTGVSSFIAYAPIFGGTTSGGNLQSGAVGTAGQSLTSNGAGALPTFQDPPVLPIDAQTGTTYTLVSADAPASSGYAGMVTMSNASANTMTVPTNASVAFPVGTQVVVQQLGAGQTTIAAAGGVTINSPYGLAIFPQYGIVTLLKTATNTWQLSSGPSVATAPGKTLTVNNSITLIGTDGVTYTLPATNATLARTDAGQTFTGASTTTSWTHNTPVIAGGMTASGSGSNDFSGSTGTFKLPTGGLIAADSGLAHRFHQNFSATPQTPTAATRTYLAGSGITITAGQLQVGTVIRWHLNMTKTAAGSATSTFDIAFGTAGTTSDTARVSFTKPAGTAVIDEAWVDVECVVKTNSSSGVVVGEFRMIHNLSATGHAVIPSVAVNTVSGTFDTTLPTKIGLCITTGASDAITINQVSAEAFNL